MYINALQAEAFAHTNECSEEEEELVDAVRDAREREWVADSAGRGAECGVGHQSGEDCVGRLPLRERRRSAGVLDRELREPERGLQVAEDLVHSTGGTCRDK